MKPIIEIENLSKCYKIGANKEPYLSLRDEVAKFASRLRPRTKDQGQSETDFWALKDVSFSIQEGETVGIIGRNGAGKSTLLKILSQITPPTTGKITMRGRVASLLEVGTGFHPELSGRENIFLNGAILGMSREEIRRKFDEIVAFAEIDKFLDTPVKRYSSGMYVRLAFAVAAHLEPEILIVDEVLAVGDAQFQKKCLGKMGEVASQGRTVLFVSHNMSAIRQLCKSCIWLSNGTVKGVGPSAAIMGNYLQDTDKSGGNAEICFEQDLQKEFQVLRGRLVNAGQETVNVFHCDEEFTIELTCVVNQYIPGLYGYMSLVRTDGVTVIESDSFDILPNQLDDLKEGQHLLGIVIPARTIGAGNYLIYFNFSSPSGVKGHNIDSPGHMLSFTLEDPNTKRGNNRNGYLSTCLGWKVQPV